MLFEELIVEAKFDDGEEATSKQAVAMVFEDLKMNNLRMYFNRLDQSCSVAEDVVSKTIVKELV